jgi:NADPH2:quinone reductase
MPHAIQIRQAGAPEVLNWTPIEVGEPARGLMVSFGQSSGPIDPIAPVLLSHKGSLFLTRSLLFHSIAQREELEISANELFNVVASGKVRINVNQRFALKDAAEAHKALEARATSGSAILTI